MSADPVGSLADEAAKLLAAMQGWAHDAHHSPAAGEAASGAVDHDTHDPLSPECRYCPLCGLARMARAATPEVRDHLASAALSLAMAAKSLLDNSTADAGGPTPVEKIDLAED